MSLRAGRAREAYGDLVLLCHEAPGAFCHRLVLAEWLAEHRRTNNRGPVKPVEEVFLVSYLTVGSAPHHAS